ncbi:MAG: sigma-70 family RNA polymerase sigma factor [Planctomycetes bacterium]|nr:sigma-70 family RNA polymerase sigma factor [Planctomycetota bacterium]
MKASDEVRDRFADQALPYRQYLFGQAYAHTHNPEEADDLVQETLARGLEKFHQFRHGTNLKAWLSRIMSNIFISQYRKRRCRPQPTSIEGLEGMLGCKTPEDPQPHLEAMPPGEIAVDDGFLQSLDERLKLGIETMGRRYRDAFLLNTIGNLSYSEVACRLQVPPGTIMSRPHRARTAMREAYAASA